MNIDFRIRANKGKEMALKPAFLTIFIAITTLAALVTVVAPPPAQAEECAALVARLHNQPICESDIAPPQESMADIAAEYREQGLDPAAAILQQNRIKLRDLIWMKALTEKFGRDAYEPTAEEIDAYRADSKQRTHDKYEDNRKISALIRTLLQNNRYSAEHTILLQDILLTSEKSVSFYEQRQEHLKEMPEEFVAMMAETEEKIAEAMIRNWKIDKLLYDTYGGPVFDINDQPEPAGAYRAFINHITSDAGLVILNRDYRDIFKEMAEQLDRLLANPPPDSASDDDFTAPSWAFPYIEGAGSDYEDMKATLEALPVLSASE